MKNEFLKLAKIIANHLGIKGDRGGWLKDAGGNVICQGWESFTAICVKRNCIRDRQAPFIPNVDWRKVALWPKIGR